MLLSVEEYQRIRGRKPDFWEALSRFRDDTELDELAPDEVWADVRDPSEGRDSGF